MVYVPGAKLKIFDVCQVVPLSAEYSNVPVAPEANIATVPIPAVAHDAADAAYAADNGLFEITRIVSAP